jgi:hypothetical protein
MERKRAFLPGEIWLKVGDVIRSRQPLQQYRTEQSEVSRGHTTGTDMNVKGRAERKVSSEVERTRKRYGESRKSRT